MKQAILLMLCISTFTASSQVAPINSNRSLTFASPLSNTKSIFYSATDSSVWASDGTLAGTILLSPDILFSSNIGVLNGKFIFGGSTAATGKELFITDGTPRGTVLVADIEPGAPASDPQPGGAILNGYLYFNAITLAAGKELWRTNGTDAGTAMVADIVANAPGSESIVISPLLINSRVFFQADNKDNLDETDLYAVNGTFSPIVVPVKLIDFTVIPRAGDAALKWHITQQINCRDYTIQRSDDGKNFINIGTVPAIGTSANTLVYSFTDANITASGKPILYYRLMITDIDGKTANSNIILLKLDRNAGWDARLLANPVAENLPLILSGARQEVQLTVLDVSGKVSYYASLEPVSGQLSVPVASLAKGIYILVVQVGNEKKSIRFVK